MSLSSVNLVKNMEKNDEETLYLNSSTTKSSLADNDDEVKKPRMKTYGSRRKPVEDDERDGAILDVVTSSISKKSSMRNMIVSSSAFSELEQYVDAMPNYFESKYKAEGEKLDRETKNSGAQKKEKRQAASEQIKNHGDEKPRQYRNSPFGTSQRRDSISDRKEVSPRSRAASNVVTPKFRTGLQGDEKNPLPISPNSPRVNSPSPSTPRSRPRFMSAIPTTLKVRTILQDDAEKSSSSSLCSPRDTWQGGEELIMKFSVRIPVSRQATSGALPKEPSVLGESDSSH